MDIFRKGLSEFLILLLIGFEFVAGILKNQIILAAGAFLNALIYSSAVWQIYGFFKLLTITPIIKTPMLTTIHSSLPPEPAVLRKAFKDRFYVSISNAQRELAPELNWIATVYHGIDVKKYPFSEKEGEYLLFLGTFSPHKGPDIAIEISKKAGIPIILAGEIRKEFEEFYREKILPQQDGRQIKVFGELTFQQKAELLKNALALILPVRWKEAFGLVMIEAMACGTPVIAFRKGSTQEVIQHGITGFLVASVQEACEALQNIDKIERTLCRKAVQEKFSREVMAENYLKIYKKLMEETDENSTGCTTY